MAPACTLNGHRVWKFYPLTRNTSMYLIHIIVSWESLISVHMWNFTWILDFRMDFWISNWISGFQKRISGFHLNHYYSEHTAKIYSWFMHWLPLSLRNVEMIVGRLLPLRCSKNLSGIPKQVVLFTCNTQIKRKCWNRSISARVLYPWQMQIANFRGTFRQRHMVERGLVATCVCGGWGIFSITACM